MRVLLTDASSLSARQVATILGRGGHEVEALGPGGITLCGLTRHVRRVHRVPMVGRDPEGWLDAACRLCRQRRIDVLFPTQEQAALLSAHPERVAATGAATAVPPFAAIARVQDKVSAARTLTEAGLAQPPSAVAATAADLRAMTAWPAFAKAAIGTASAAVHRVVTAADLEAAVRAFQASGAFANGGVLVQQPAGGPLAMVQAVYADGKLVAHHVNLRVHEAVRGGASHKRSLVRPDIEADLRRIGAMLRWHGALCFDAILTPDGPLYIDVNPRLVESANAWFSGVDLPAAMLDIALGRSVPAVGPGTPDVRTHQLLLGLLDGAGRPHPRRAVAAELRDGLLHRGRYANSREELTPPRGDLRTTVPVAVAAAQLLARPRRWERLAGAATEAYSMSPLAWHALVAARSACHP